MTKRLQLQRMLALTLIMCAAFAGLGYRLVDLQVLRHDELSKLAQDNTQREFRQADCQPTISAGSTPLIRCSCCRFPFCAPSSATSSSQAFTISTARACSTSEVLPLLSVILRCLIN